jgi:hypothetical protein
MRIDRQGAGRAVAARRTVRPLIAVQALDAVICAIPIRAVREDLDRLGVPEELRSVIPAVKALSVIGLLIGLRRPSVGRVTSAALILYFVLAIGAHARIRDEAWRYGAAIGMLTWSWRAWRSFSIEPAPSLMARRGSPPANRSVRRRWI